MKARLYTSLGREKSVPGRALSAWRTFERLDIWLLCWNPERAGVRAGDIKKVCETEIGVLSQCVLSKHVGKCQAQYLSNVALKINLKVTFPFC